jgi:hypothetical protein
VAGEEVFWAEKEGGAEGDEEAKKGEEGQTRFLNAELDNSNSTLDIEENSPEWDNL